MIFNLYTNKYLFLTYKKSHLFFGLNFISDCLNHKIFISFLRKVVYTFFKKLLLKSCNFYLSTYAKYLL